MQILLWDHYDAVMGGIEKLIITLARDFAAHHDVVVISGENGTIRKGLCEAGASFTPVDPWSADLGCHVSGDALLVDFGTFPEMRQLAGPNPKVLIWRVFTSFRCKGRLGKVLFRSMLRNLDRRGSLVFMDGVCHRNACREMGQTFSKQILPLPIIGREKRYSPRDSTGVVNITYVGRGSRIWKVKPVKKLVTDLATLSDLSFRVHVFTDTRDLFEAELAEVTAPNTEVQYHLGYTMDALSEKLVELADLHYSMGTACLEGAAMGIPALIADACYEDFPEKYRYRWLIEDLDNYAGVFLDGPVPDGHPLAEIIASTREPRELLRLSDATYAAVASHFVSERVAIRLGQLRPQARIRDVLRYMPSYWMHGGPLGRL